MSFIGVAYMLLPVLKEMIKNLRIKVENMLRLKRQKWILIQLPTLIRKNGAVSMYCSLMECDAAARVYALATGGDVTGCCVSRDRRQPSRR